MTDDSTLATVTAERDNLRQKVIDLEAKISELTAPKAPVYVAWFVEEDFDSIERFDSEHEASVATSNAGWGAGKYSGCVGGYLFGVDEETGEFGVLTEFPDQFKEKEINAAMAAYAEATK